ncbi:MAG TPA: C40 family peptidase [Puia sp.]|jgi:lipoprotein Spr|nr:C40 family peptidase [Puia sp.]
MLKTSTFIVALFLLASCSTVRPGPSRQSASATTTATSSSGSVQFIDNISVTPSGKQDKAVSSISPVGKSAGSESTGATSGAGIENYPAPQFKFAILENATVEEVNNPKLLSFMDYWYGAPYHYGGMSRDGVDCSGFSFLLMSSVYGVVSLPRTAKDQYGVSRHIRRDELREGDLVFFHTLGRRRAVTHVGVYLRNNKFIHASVSGVMISDLNEGYYERHYIGAGRVLAQGREESSPGTTAVVGASH